MKKVIRNFFIFTTLVILLLAIFFLRQHFKVRTFCKDSCSFLPYPAWRYKYENKLFEKRRQCINYCLSEVKREGGKESYLNFISRKEETREGIIWNEGEEEELSFELDLNALSYNLPKHTLACIPEEKFSCSLKEGCKRIKPTIFVLYDELNRKIYRCDKNPCDEYEAVEEKSGLYTNVQTVSPKGFSIKVSEDGNYFEQVSIGLRVLLSFGQCAPSPLSEVE